MYAVVLTKLCFCCVNLNETLKIQIQFTTGIVHTGKLTATLSKRSLRIVGLSSNKNSTPPFNYRVSQASAFCRLIYHACEKTTSMTHPDISYSIIYIITYRIPRGDVYRIFKEHYIRGPPFNYQGGRVFLK